MYIIYFNIHRDENERPEPDIKDVLSKLRYYKYIIVTKKA